MAAAWKRASFFSARLLENLGLSLQNDRQVGVPLGPSKEPFERFRRGQAQRIDLEHLAIESDRRIDVAEVGLLHPRARHEERARERRVLGLGRELFEHAGEIREASRRASDAIELLLGGLVGGVFLQRASERGEGRTELTRRVLVQLRDLMQELHATHDVVAATHLHLVSADELLPVSDVSIEWLQQVRDRELVLLVPAKALERR